MRARVDPTVADLEVPGLIIHAVNVAVAEDAVVAAPRAFPRRIMLESDPARFGVVQFESGISGYGIDQSVINEELTTSPDIRDLGGAEAERQGEMEEGKGNIESVHETGVAIQSG
jgi:hypothetical protein